MRPSELHQLAYTGLLDPDFTFSANSAARYRINERGVLVEASANQPRFTFDLATSKPRGLMIYEAITNLHTNSETLSTGVGSTISANTDTAPDGAMTMDSLIEDTSLNEHYPNDFSFTPVIGRYYLFSCFVKALGAGSIRRAQIRMAGGHGSLIVFDLVSKTVTTTGGSNFVSMPLYWEEWPNGVFRLWTQILAASTTSTVARAQLHNGSSASYTGDGLSGLKIWGRQLKESLGYISRPDPYVKTAGSAVTTAADLCAKPVSVGSEYSIYAEFIAPESSVNVQTIFVLDDGSGSNEVRLRVSGGSVALIITKSSVVEANIILKSLTSGRAYKVAMRIRENDVAACINSEAVLTDTSVSIPTVTTERLGHNSSNTGHLNSTIADFEILPGCFTNTELQAITR